MKFQYQKYIAPEKFEVLPAGNYTFKIMKIEEKCSKAGNPMIELFLKLNHKSSPVGCAYDYILDMENMVWKRKHLLESLGKGNLFETQEFGPNEIQQILGAEGTCIVIQDFKDGVASGNKIKDYVAKTESKQTDAFVDSTIPF
jgi:hypothetical protein